MSGELRDDEAFVLVKVGEEGACCERDVDQC
jgi:hypothetical protein